MVFGDPCWVLLWACWIEGLLLPGERHDHRDPSKIGDFVRCKTLDFVCNLYHPLQMAFLVLVGHDSIDSYSRSSSWPSWVFLVLQQSHWYPMAVVMGLETQIDRSPYQMHCLSEEHSMQSLYWTLMNHQGRFVVGKVAFDRKHQAQKQAMSVDHLVFQVLKSKLAA